MEHNDEFIKASDWVVEIGPGSGDFGGKLLFNGPIDAFAKSNTLTAQYMTGKKRIEVSFDHHPQDKCIKMKKAEYQPIAVKGISNNMAIALYGIEYGIDDYAMVGGICGDRSDTPRKYKIYWAVSGRPYFRRYGRREYIDEYGRL